MKAPAKMVFDKFQFFADCDYTPHAGQRAIHASDARHRVVVCGTRWGKSTCAAMEGLAAALKPAEHSVGWVVGPIYELANRVFGMMVLLARKYFPERIYKCSESDGVLVLINMSGGRSVIQTKSAESPDSLLGEGLDWVIVDEASRLRSKVWEGYLAARLLNKKGWALLISTPHGKGYFYDLWKRGMRKEYGWQSWKSPTWDNPLLDRKAIEDTRATMEARTFRQEYGAEFLEDSGAVFKNVRDCATGTFAEREKGRRYFAGLDLARHIDHTVLVIVDDRLRVVYVDRMRDLDWSIQMERILSGLKQYGNPRLRADSTGSGQPVCEELRKRGAEVVGYKFTQQSKEALIGHLGLVFDQRKIVLPTPHLWPEGIQELEDYRYSTSESGSVTCSAPSGSHDDIVIAVGLAAWEWKVFDSYGRPVVGIPGLVVFADDY